MKRSTEDVLNSKQDVILNFQPIINIDNGDVHHYEILCRLKDNEYKSPYEYVVSLENDKDSSGIVDFDMHVIEKSIAKLNSKESGNAHIAINVSGRSIQDSNFVMKFDELLENTEQSIKDRMQIEITESVPITDYAMANMASKTIRHHGLTLSLDDYGIGHPDYNDKENSLSGVYLDKIDGFTYVKVEGEHVDKLENGTRMEQIRAKSIIENIVNMAHESGCKVIAERVETDRQHNLLQEMGIDYGQGYLYGKPGKDMNYSVNESTRDLFESKSIVAPEEVDRPANSNAVIANLLQNRYEHEHTPELH